VASADISCRIHSHFSFDAACGFSIILYLKGYRDDTGRIESAGEFQSVGIGKGRTPRPPPVIGDDPIGIA